MKKVDELKKVPTLVTIQIDNNEQYHPYIDLIREECKNIHIDCIHFNIDSQKYSQEDLCNIITAFSNDEIIDGIIILLPIPEKYILNELLSCIASKKDVGILGENSIYEKYKTIDLNINVLSLLDNTVSSYIEGNKYE